jgi:A/G-specific adenine glycosylase
MTTGRPGAALLLDWYEANRRDLPWRQTRDPYSTVVSEFMLHQTRVTTAIPYYTRFLQRFPDWTSLANATLDGVLKSWEGMGYYARARNLHALARQVVGRHAGRLPDTPTELMALPGMGEYTVGAILSIVFNQDVPAVDGNGRRVLSRLFAVREDPSRGIGKQRIRKAAEALLPPGRAAQFNQALMDLGSAICTPRQPRCLICPLTPECEARKMDLQDALPVVKTPKALPHYDIAAGIVWHQGRILIARRPTDGLLGGLWEFPGGKTEMGESLTDAVRREIREELGIEVRVGDLLGQVNHAYTHFRITLYFYRCEYVSGDAVCLACSAWKWVTPAELSEYAFPAANRTVIALLQSISV